MRKVGRYIIYDADDEEPICFRCDHVCQPSTECADECGPEHWWSRYERTTYEGDRI